MFAVKSGRAIGSAFVASSSSRRFGLTLAIEVGLSRAVWGRRLADSTDKFVVEVAVRGSEVSDARERRGAEKGEIPSRHSPAEEVDLGEGDSQQSCERR